MPLSDTEPESFFRDPDAVVLFTEREPESRPTATEAGAGEEDVVKDANDETGERRAAAELRSTMEELETSKEELQSINEELQTVNQENRHKVEELSQLSADLQNLMAATDIATLFLDRAGRILRYTPKVTELFNVRPADRGRPIADLTHRLEYDEFQQDAARVLDRPGSVEREIRDEEGRWYMTRMLPYRSREDRIEGVVVTFVDITDRKRMEEALLESRDYAESIVETLHEPLLVLDPDLRVRTANPVFYDHFDVREDETIGRLIYELGNGQWDIPELRTLLEDVLPDSEVFSEYEVRHEFDDIGERVMMLNGRRLDHVQLILLGIRDITDRKRAEEALRENRVQLERELEDTRKLQQISSLLIEEEGKDALDRQLLDAAVSLLRADMGSLQVLDPETEVLHLTAWTGFHPDSAAYWATVDRDSESACGSALRRGERLLVPDVDADERLEGTESLGHYHLSGIAALQSTPLVSRDGHVVGMISTHWRQPHTPSEREWGLFDVLARQAADVVERKRAEEALRESEENYRTLFESMDEGFCVLEMLFDEAGEPVDYRFLEANPAFEHQAGLANPVGRRMRDLAPGHEEHWFRRYGQIATTGKPERFVEEARELGGRWFDVSAFRVGEPEARTVAVFFKDITARKTAEGALRRSEMELRALIGATMDIVYRMNPDWSELRRLEGRGLDPDNVTSTGSWLEHIHPDDRADVLEAVQEAIRAKSVLELEHRVRRADGTTGWMLSRAVPILDDEGEITEWMGAATDVTERKQWQDDLERRVVERTREVRELAETLSVAEQEERQRLSHLLHDDLQQLLYGVQMKVSLAQDDARREGLQSIVAQTERGLELLKDAIIRTRQLTVDLNPPILDSEGLMGAIEWLRTQMRDLYNLTVEVEADGEVDIRAPDLRILLFQTTRELLFNVAKHAGTDRAVVEVRTEEDRVRVIVTDHGKGFDPAELETPKSGRRGLGLVRARERLRMRKGDLVIEPGPGGGSRVAVHAPLSSDT